MPSILACEAVVLRYLLLVHLILLHLTREIETPSLPCSSRNRRDPLKPPQNPGLAQNQVPGLRSEPSTRTAFLLEGDTYTKSKGLDAVNPQRKRRGQGDERTRTIMAEIFA